MISSTQHKSLMIYSGNTRIPDCSYKCFFIRESLSSFKGRSSSCLVDEETRPPNNTVVLQYPEEQVSQVTAAQQSPSLPSQRSAETAPGKENQLQTKLSPKPPRGSADPDSCHLVDFYISFKGSLPIGKKKENTPQTH